MLLCLPLASCGDTTWGSQQEITKVLAQNGLTPIEQRTVQLTTPSAHFPWASVCRKDGHEFIVYVFPSKQVSQFILGENGRLTWEQMIHRAKSEGLADPEQNLLASVVRSTYPVKEGDVQWIYQCSGQGGCKGPTVFDVFGNQVQLNSHGG